MFLNHFLNHHDHQSQPSTFPARNTWRAAAALPQGRTARRAGAIFAARNAGAGAGAAVARPGGEETSWDNHLEVIMVIGYLIGLITI